MLVFFTTVLRQLTPSFAFPVLACNFQAMEILSLWVAFAMVLTLLGSDLGSL